MIHVLTVRIGLALCLILATQRRYLEYAGPVQSTYDTIVGNSLSLLRGMSLDERASKLRDQFKSREVLTDTVDRLTEKFRV